MTTPPSDSPQPPPAWKPLAPRERRVLGVLIEKAKTTPAGYPMSVNAIVAGCNQKNNRDPLTSYDDADVEDALRELTSLGVVSEIDWLGRVSKFKHQAYDWFGVGKAELAVLAELMLRGAQTLGDLRARAARMEPIEDVDALKPIVRALLDRGLMLELTPPGRGQIVSHNLYTAPERAELRTSSEGSVRHGVPSGREDAGARAIAPPPSPAPASGTGPALAALVAEIEDLRAEVARLTERVRQLESRLDAGRG